LNTQPKSLYSQSKLAARVAALGRTISRDYAGKTLDVVIMLENGFLFGADLVRRLNCPVVCHFMRSELRDIQMAGYPRREIFFTRPPVLRDRNILLVDAVLQTGVTHDFLAKRLLEAGPRSLRLAVLVDKPAHRRVNLRADYFGFVGASKQLVGYGLAARQGLFRNLPYIGTLNSGRLAAGRAKRQGRAAASLAFGRSSAKVR
jgi:hypoxanthine phosphoribosyltransferase